MTVLINDLVMYDSIPVGIRRPSDVVLGPSVPIFIWTSNGRPKWTNITLLKGGRHWTSSGRPNGTFIFTENLENL